MKNVYDNTNTGLLVANERRKHDNHPTHQGSAEIKCTQCGVVSQHWLSAWVKTGGATSKLAGKRFFSLAFKSKVGPQLGAEMPATPTPPATDFNDEVPF